MSKDIWNRLKNCWIQLRPVYNISFQQHFLFSPLPVRISSSKLSGKNSILKIFKYVLIITAIALIILISGISFYLYISGPLLPSDTDAIISQVMENPLPELVGGVTGFADAQGLQIWYESIVPADSVRGSVLLIMGISNDALGWPLPFIHTFVDSGYQVIRYDHRGTGLSDWVTDWDNKNPYSLEDMADDGIAVLNALDIEKAHIIGISMGGMIAQEIIINHPERAATLTSIMSSGFIIDPDLDPISSDIAWELIKISLKYGIIGGERNMIKLHLASRIILAGEANYELNTREIAEQVLYNIRRRKGYNFNVSQQHQGAVYMSGSRYDELMVTRVPVLIIHGRSDPFIPIAHGEKYASLITEAETLWLDNMGHDLPGVLIDTLTYRIMKSFGRQHQNDM
jgi:pimeloyl-ACP methyl ester carboxylesterase